MATVGLQRAALTLWVWPSVETAGEKIGSRRQPGYRDSLCAFITHAVTGVAEAPEEGPEFAMYDSGLPKAMGMVWLVSEPPFESFTE